MHDIEMDYLCRGKRKDNGTWVEGCLLIDFVTGQYFIHACGNSVCESKEADEKGYLKFVAYEVDPKTVCRHSGRKDCNGAGIYELDIVNINGYCVGEVIWDDDITSFTVMPYGEQERIEVIGEICNDASSDIEVIGNFFDNPDLIGGDSFYSYKWRE